MSLVAGICTIVMNQSPAQLRLPGIIGSNMVLQAGGRAPVWGWTAPGRAVTVKFRGEVKKTTANAAGEWQVAFRSLKAGLSGTMTITDGDTTLDLENILVGDVWICSGQSNMEWPLNAVNNAQWEVANARYSQMRLFMVTKNAAVGWKGDVDGKWVVCTPESAASFSAVGYFFGRSLTLSEKKPIGLIDTSWGGTPAEAWTPKDTLLAHPQTKGMWEDYVKGFEDIKKKEPELMEILKQPAGQIIDSGNKGEPAGWAKPAADLAEWKPASIPNLFENIPNLLINGVVWFRRTFTVTAEQAAQPSTLSLGPIDDVDITYVNGVKVGETTMEIPNWWSHPRRYSLPAGTLKAGENTVAVRVFDSGGAGGFGGTADQLKLESASGSIALAGDWLYRVEHAVKRLPPGAAVPNNPNAPTALWDGMVQPIVPLGIKGAIWYQGESNVGRSDQYSVLFPSMITAWRQAFAQGSFPFLYVQLANYMARHDQPVNSSWAELRESQEAALKLPNTGSAVIIDIGEAGDIHPRNKQDVGERLAMSARSFAYKGSQPAGNSPRFTAMVPKGNDAVISFKDAAGLRTKDGSAPKGFAVLGADGKWVWGRAVIEGEKIVVSHPGGGRALQVRYAWADNPEVNVVNSLGLPMCPFRTDQPSWMK